MIVIIDYGMGNLRSAQKAFEFLGYEAIISDDIKIIENASKLVLPGVGAFADAMEKLNSTGLSDIIRNQVAKGIPFLGICLGMQLIFQRSYEGGCFEGLSLVDGEIIKFDLTSEYKVPQIGWNKLKMNDCVLFDGIDKDTYTYFVHSYYAKPKDQSIIAGTCDYGIEFCAAVHKDNIYATQFHPEKSGDLGLAMLNNFAKI